MKRTLLSSMVLGPALLLAALAAPGIAAAAGPITSTACATVGTTTTCNLWAETGTLALPGPASVPIWGFADTPGGSPTVPGPVLVANQGDSVTVNLTNDLAVATSIVFDGQAMVPDLTGVAAGATTSYTFTADAPGTYLYEAGLIPGSQYQVAMGMYGVLVVRPAGAPGQAYGDASTAFNDEAVVALGEVDPALNTSATPWNVDLRYFNPRYALVNGVAYTGTAPAINVTSGNTLLLRYANAGIQHHSIGVLGLRQSVLAADGSEIAFPRGMVAETIAPGQTADVLVALPATTATSTKYALYDASMSLNNAGASGIGGMLAFIDASGAASGTDTVGPITSNVAFAPATGVASASVSDVETGNSGVGAAEYFIDATGTPGSGLAMTGSFPSDPAAVTATLDATVLAGLASGSHTIYVHGQDSVGNWGTFSSASFTIDRAGPTTSALVLTPSHTNGTVNVAISATADDTATGNSNVTAAEYTLDGGAAVAMTLNKVAPTASLTASISAATVNALTEGAHTVSVRSQDAAGNWGTAVSATLTVDKTGPATSGVSTNPPTANNGKLGQSSSNPSVRVSATIADAASTVAAGEGFIDSVGANGTGFTFTATDGVFNAASEAVYSDIPLTTINSLSAGNHPIYVHGKDTAGNWGPVASYTLLIDKTAPTFTGLSLAPNPTYGAATVTLTVNGAADPLVGGLASGVTGGEYWIDSTAPAAGSGTAFSGLTASIPVGTLATGSHTVGARIRDAAGNWSTTGSATFTVIPDAIFSNGFETGTRPWGWSSASTNSTGRLDVTAGAALVGSRGLQAAGNNTNYVQYNFGTAANPASPTYDVRFYFNPNGNSSTGKDILAAATNAAFGTQLFHVRYRLNGSTPQVQVQVGATANATWVTITPGAHYLEAVWQAVGSGGPNPGTLVLYVDGVSSQTLTTTSTGSVGAVRLGSVTNTGANTAMYFDAFASKRTVSPLVGP